MTVTNFIFILCICACVCLWACTPTPKEHDNTHTDVSFVIEDTVSLSEAADWTRAWRDSTQDGISTSLWTDIHFKGFEIPREDLAEVLDEPGMYKARIYLGIKQGADGAKDTAKVVLVGVDSLGNDMTSGYILDYSHPCPPGCGDSNPLNSDE